MRVGIVGCGLIGSKRATSIAGHQIVAVTALERPRAEALARAHNAMAVPHWRDVIAADVDAVIVATSHDVLAEITLAAIEAGHHALVEKPGGRNAAEIAPIVDVAKKGNRVVKVGFNHRFHPSFRKAKAMVDAGELGPLMYIRGRYGHGGRPGMESEWRCRSERSGGGELIDQGSHLIDLSRWFLGDLTVEYGHTPTWYWDIPVDDNCFVALRSANGQLAWLHASWTEWKNMFSFEIVGRDGKLVVDGLGGSYGTERLTFYRMLAQMGPPETTIWEFPFPDTSWSEEFEDFVAAIAGTRRACGDIFDAYANMKVIDRIYGKNET